MQYLEWNKCISKYFFNPQNSGKDVYLYITKNDIVSLGEPLIKNASKEHVWNDFLISIKNGLAGSTYNSAIVEKAVDCFNAWKGRSPKSVKDDAIAFPSYIAYLIFFILPLTEEEATEFQASNYYGRLETFLKANNINHERGNLQNLEELWSDLEEWSILVTNGDSGFFTLGKFSDNRKYVGKLFSQCIFSPSAIKKLPELFFESKMVPDSFYNETEIKDNLLAFGSPVLGLRSNILELIKKSESNELGQSIIRLVKREYAKWTGESHELIISGENENTKRNFTVSPLLLQFKLNTNEGEIKFSFRMYSANDYPEDLKFGNIEVLNASKGYSNILALPDKTNLEPFEKEDEFNKWIARFPRKDIRLFISGSYFQLSADYWIETEQLSRIDRMILLCRNGIRDKIQTWGAHFNKGNFNIIDDLDGLPAGYSMFSLFRPSESLKDFPILTVYTQKTIQLSGGLKITHRSFTIDFLPEVEIINSDGNESVYLQYRNHEEKIFLKKNQTFNNRWLLPNDIACNVDFHIKVENENFTGNDIAYSITSTENSALKVDDANLPKRDKFGRKANTILPYYSIGSNVVGGSLRRQESYKQFFVGITEDTDIDLTVPVYLHQRGNILLSFLTYLNVSTTEEFYAAFEFLHSKYFDNQISINYSKIKKAALNMYDYLGYLDYDYETKEIVVNKPQFIFIPAAKGRRILLIGGRDAALVQSIIKVAPKYKLKVEITKQSISNENLLLPDAIIVKAYGKKTETYGENRLKEFADELKIMFNPNDLIQIGMQEFSADIEEYEKELLANNETNQEDYDWARKIFNPDSLQYEKSFGETFDKSFALVEYKLNEYTYHNKLWKDQKCYSIDKNWGKYLALKYYGKQQEILYDTKARKVAVPLELPLPRLLAESIILLSGLAPIYCKIQMKAYRVYENIPSPFIKNLFDKLKQTTREVNL